MITSLFKIVGLSLLSLFPFDKLVASSIPHDLTANEVEKVDFKANKKSLYDPYLDFIVINPSDLDNGYYDDIVLTSSQGIITENFSIQYIIDGQNTYNQVNCNGIQIGSHLGSFTTITTYVGGHSYHSIYTLDFSNHLMNRQLFVDNSLSSTTNVLSYRFTSQNSSAYSSFFSEVKSYINDNTAITFTSDMMNAYSYRAFTDYIVENENVISYSSCEYNSQNGLVSVENNSVEFELGDDKIVLYSDSDIKPNYVFYSVDFNDSPIGDWQLPLVLYVNDFDNYFILNNLVSQRESIYQSSNIVENFVFSYSFNYNAPYNSTKDNIFIKDSYFTSEVGTTLLKQKEFSLPYFYSNGELYNAFGVDYTNGYSSRYGTGNGGIAILRDAGYGYFSGMYFKNTDTGNVKYVYFRSYGETLDSNDNYQTYISSGGTWINNEYRYLHFLVECSSSQRNDLAQFNNEGQFSGLSGGNVDMNSTLTLIASTISSFTTFFSIVILPGITIGTLILIPFAISLLLLIIKMFKR